MKVQAYRDPIRQRFNILVELGTDPSGKRLYMASDSSIVDVAFGEEPPLYMSIPEQIANALAEALDPRPPATERHLDDAIDVRDRMITLVESYHKSITESR